MSGIIRYTSLMDASCDRHEDYRAGDWLLRNYDNGLYKIVSVEENKGKWYYSLQKYNAITLQTVKGVFDGLCSEQEIKEYYKKMPLDPVKARDMGHRILFEGAKIESFQGSDENTLMALNSKQALIALHTDIEKSREMVGAMQSYCNAMTSQMISDLKTRTDAIEEITCNMQREIRKLDYVIQTIETYAGIKVEVISLHSGERASEDVPLVVRQAVLFMDEEFALIDDDFDWRKEGKFDKWLVENDNFKELLPDEKSIVAIKPRRTRLEYSDDAWTNFIMDKPNHVTLFLVRNGDNLYKLESEYVALEDRMFPNKDEYQKVLEEEAKGAGFNHDSDLKKSAFMRRRFTKIAFLLQGLLDRSDVFSPHHSKCNFLKMDGFDGSVEMRYELDTSRLLEDGRPSVMDWIRQTNSKLSEGKRIILVVGDYSFKGYDIFTPSCFIRSYMYDSNAPSYPVSGIYTLKANPCYVKGSHSLYSYRDNYPYMINYRPGGFYDDYRNNKVNIAVDIENKGVLNYDDLNIDDLDYYLNSRLYRSQYFNYVRLLKKARKIMEEEKTSENDFLSLLAGECISRNWRPKDGLELRQIAEKALQTVKDRLKWKRPISSKEKETYTLVKRTMFSKNFKSKYFK